MFLIVQNGTDVLFLGHLGRNKESYTTSYEEYLVSLSHALHTKTKTLVNADAERDN